MNAPNPYLPNATGTAPANNYQYSAAKVAAVFVAKAVKNYGWPAAKAVVRGLK